MGARKAPRGTRAHAARRPPVTLPRLVAGLAALAAALCVALLVHAAVGPGPDPGVGPARPDPTTFAVLAPADGDLLVGGVAVRQLAGRCRTDGVCEYAYPARVPRLRVSAGTPSVPLAAGRSATYTVSVYATDGADTSRLRMAVADGRLLLDRVPAGAYRVTISGDRHGTWQFDLTVTGQHKHPRR